MNTQKLHLVLTEFGRKKTKGLVGEAESHMANQQVTSLERRIEQPGVVVTVPRQPLGQDHPSGVASHSPALTDAI